MAQASAGDAVEIYRRKKRPRRGQGDIGPNNRKGEEDLESTMMSKRGVDGVYVVPE